MDLLLPKIAYADFNGFLTKVNANILQPLINFLFALAIVFFLYGVFEFLMNSDNEEKRITGRNHMIWGIVGLTIMIGVFGILNLIIKTFDIKGVDPENNVVNLQ